LVSVYFGLFANGFLEPAGTESYYLAQESHDIRLQESFDILVCLPPSLSQIRSFWYQEETFSSATG